MTNQRIYWEGIYSSFAEVPVENDGFNQGEYGVIARHNGEELLRKVSSYKSMPFEVVDMRWHMPLIAAMLSRRTGRLQVLDYGGSVGTDFIHLTSSLNKPIRLHYHVIENESIARIGSELLKGDSRISYGENLPKEFSPDLLFFNSSLQYVEDYAELLKRYCALGPECVLITRLPGGDVPTYATAQKNLPGTVLPHWIINVPSLTSLLDGLGYELLSRGVWAAEFNQNNLPEEYRFGRMANLLFQRKLLE